MALQNLMELLRDLLARLESGGIPYMVVGSVSSIIYGEPRMTKDLDLVINVAAQDAQRLEALFALDDFYCPPPEILRDEIIRRGQFNLIHHDSGLKIDLIVRKNSPHAIEEFKRRRRIEFWEEFEAYVAAPEDVVIKKLDYYREGRSEKHLEDCRGILANTELDREYLVQWLTELGLMPYWARLGPGDRHSGRGQIS